MLFILLLLFSALAVSSVAGYFSVLGLMSIFPAASVAVGVMGASLELAKLTTASWIYRYWKTSNLLIKTYFMIAVMVLSVVTSIGIFGYLSKAHLESATLNQGSQFEIQQLLNKKSSEERRIVNAQTSLDTLDRLATGENIERANTIRNRQRGERTSINKEIAEASGNIQTIENDLLPLQTSNLKIEAELGPIKYVAELFYGKGDAETVDKAVRLLIIIIIFVFDPLAILLVVAANMSIHERNQQLTTEKKDLTNEEKPVNMTKQSEEYPTDNFFSYPEPEITEITEIEEMPEVDDSGSVHGVGTLVEEKAKKHAEDQVMIRKSNIRRL